MKSMTGYGFREIQRGTVALILEIKTYNNRYLDLAVNLPHQLNPLEQKIREYLSERMRRGRIEVFIRITDTESDLVISVDEGAVSAYAQALDRLALIAGIEEPVRISHLLRMEDIIRTAHGKDPENYWSLIQEALDQVYSDVENSRKHEGEATRKNILLELDKIIENHNQIKERVPQIEESLKMNLEKRFKELLEEADEQRMYAELAVLLMKYSINEELSRLDSHLASFSGIAESGGPVGKKLDFLCQEINREINTIGSKNMLSDVSMMVVTMKDSLENIREQLRNIE
ncbi:MAG: YicC/YloC family endoribonuclease [Spirochaetia bacterium]